MGSEGPAGVSGRPEDFAADRSRRLELDLAPVLRVARLTGDPVELEEIINCHRVPEDAPAATTIRHFCTTNELHRMATSSAASS